MLFFAWVGLKYCSDSPHIQDWASSRIYAGAFSSNTLLKRFNINPRTCSILNVWRSLGGTMVSRLPILAAGGLVGRENSDWGYTQPTARITTFWQKNKLDSEKKSSITIVYKWKLQYYSEISRIVHQLYDNRTVKPSMHPNIKQSWNRLILPKLTFYGHSGPGQPSSD